MSADRINELCEKFCLATASGTYSAESQQHRLLENGIAFHELEYDALMTSIIGLSKVLIRPGLNTVIDFDHYALWGWCGELLLGPMAQIKIHNNQLMQHEINDLYQTCLRSALANCERPSHPEVDREVKRQNLIRSAMNPDGGERLKSSSHMILAYLAFPLLEANLKQIASEFVGLDSVVIKDFTRLSKKDNICTQHAGTEISSLKILLNLVYDHVATPDLKSLIDEFRFHLNEVSGKSDAFELIYKWRCESLHGNTNFPTIGGVILNFCLLLSIFKIKDEFASYQTDANMTWRLSLQRNMTQDNFYPPACFLNPIQL